MLLVASALVSLCDQFLTRCPLFSPSLSHCTHWLFVFLSPTRTRTCTWTMDMEDFPEGQAKRQTHETSTSKPIFDLLQRHPSCHHHQSRRPPSGHGACHRPFRGRRGLKKVTSLRLDPIAVLPPSRDDHHGFKAGPSKSKSKHTPHSQIPLSNALLHLSHPFIPSSSFARTISESTDWRFGR